MMEKLWLWRNFVDGRPEYWAFDNPYPVHMNSSDPQTLGEPCGYAIFKPSRVGRIDKTEEQVLAAIARANAPSPTHQQLVTSLERALERLHRADADPYADAEDRGDAKRYLNDARKALLDALAVRANG